MENLEQTDRVIILIKREQERQLDIKKRKEEKDESAADNERLEVFQQLYKDQKNQILKELQNSINTPINVLRDHFDAVYKGIKTLQKYVAASSVFLRVYDIQKANKELQELTNATKELEGKLLPKKKFGFKKKDFEKINTCVPNDEVSEDAVDFSSAPYREESNDCGISHRNKETLTLRREQIFKKDVPIENLTSCTLKLFGNPSTLHLSNLEDCLILSGPVSTSVFVENCKNCTLVVACQQLRVHSSKNINIYLHVTSRGVIEDSKEIFVAPYNLHYPSIDEDFETSNLDLRVNNWNCINDFNWLNTENASPNWFILPEQNRIQNCVL